MSLILVLKQKEDIYYYISLIIMKQKEDIYYYIFFGTPEVPGLQTLNIHFHTLIFIILHGDW